MCAVCLYLFLCYIPCTHTCVYVIWNIKETNCIHMDSTGFEPMHLRNSFSMMTSSNGNIYRVTGHLCGEVTGELPAQRPVMRSFDILFDLRLNERLSKQSWSWWFKTPWHPSWRYSNAKKLNANSQSDWDIQNHSTGRHCLNWMTYGSSDIHICCLMSTKIDINTS